MRRQSLYLLVLASLVLLVFLAGCHKGERDKEKKVTPAATLTEDRTPASVSVDSSVTLPLVAESNFFSDINPTCLKDTEKLTLAAGSQIPQSGVEPGDRLLFCATGAPSNAAVSFALKSPDGQEKRYDAISEDRDGVAVAVYPVTLPPDSETGKWSVIATFQGEKASFSFNVVPASHPFIVVSEPSANDPQRLHVAIGGLPPLSKSQIAVCKVGSVSIDNSLADAHGSLLPGDVIRTDKKGRADLTLNLSNQQDSHSLLVLLPENSSFTANQVVLIPNQGGGEASGTVHPDGSAGKSGAKEGTYTDDYFPSHMPASPQLVIANSALPDEVIVTLPDATLPDCNATDVPTIRMWPGNGEIGQWWFGCASGFTPQSALHASVKLGNGKETSLTLSQTDAHGIEQFQWYSTPAEGAGDFNMRLSDDSGNQADINWHISSASRPHILVLPPVIEKGTDSDIYLSGLQPIVEVKMGVYRIGPNDLAENVGQFTVKTDANGLVKEKFIAANNLEEGTYMILAQAQPTYQFSGINTTATAVEFFSVDTELEQKYQFYTLFLGRAPNMLTAVGKKKTAEIAQVPTQTPSSTPVQTTVTPSPLPTATAIPTAIPTATPTATPLQPTATPIATSTPTATPVPSTPTATPTQTVATTKNGVPKLFTLPADGSGQPVCPGTKTTQRSICFVPTTFEQGTYMTIIMQGFKRGKQFRISVKEPGGGIVRFTRKANSKGFAEAYWYALNNERLGTYRITVVGGGKKISKLFKIVKAQSPHVLVQRQDDRPGRPVIVSATGLKPKTRYIIARYVGKDAIKGDIVFKLISETAITTDKNGGAQKRFSTKTKDKGKLFVTMIFKPGNPEPLAKAVYSPGKALYLRYPYAWGGYQP